MNVSDRICDAFCFAAALHAGQRRKISGEPYLAHLMAVAALVREHGGDEDEVVAALLHDAVEDQGGWSTLEEIRRRFGRRAAKIVEGCSETAETPKPPWRPRKEAQLARLRAASASVRLIAAADKLHNVRCLLREYRRGGEAIWAHFHGGREGALWHSRAVADALNQGGDSPLVAELQRAVAELEKICS